MKRENVLLVKKSVTLSSENNMDPPTRKKRYRLIREPSGEFYLHELTRFFAMPKSFYLSWKVRHSGDEEVVVKTLIQEIFGHHKKGYGYRRITNELHQQGMPVNRKKVRQLMKELELFAVRDTKTRHSSYLGAGRTIALNILERKFDAAKPDTVWATDVMEVKTTEGKLYLLPIKDLCTGEIKLFYLIVC